MLTLSYSIAGVCPPQSQHCRHPQAALGKDMGKGGWTGAVPCSQTCHQALCYWGAGFPLMLLPLVSSQVPAQTAKQPQLVSWRGPNASTAPKGNHAGWQRPRHQLLLANGAQHLIPSLHRSKLELQGQSSIVTEELAAEVDSRGSSAEVKEPEQLGLT